MEIPRGQSDSHQPDNALAPTAPFDPRAWLAVIGLSVADRGLLDFEGRRVIAAVLGIRDARARSDLGAWSQWLVAEAASRAPAGRLQVIAPDILGLPILRLSNYSGLREALNSAVAQHRPGPVPGEPEGSGQGREAARDDAEAARDAVEAVRKTLPCALRALLGGTI